MLTRFKKKLPIKVLDKTSIKSNMTDLIKNINGIKIKNVLIELIFKENFFFCDLKYIF